MIPTWSMKFTPLPLFSRSLSGDKPSIIEGVRSNSSSVKSHCDSAIIRTSLGKAAGIGAGMTGRVQIAQPNIAFDFGREIEER